MGFGFFYILFLFVFALLCLLLYWHVSYYYYYFQTVLITLVWFCLLSFFKYYNAYILRFPIHYAFILFVLTIFVCLHKIVFYLVKKSNNNNNNSIYIHIAINGNSINNWGEKRVQQ